MLSTKAFAWFSFSFLAQAFLVPEGTPDGVYTFDPTTGIHTAADGTIVGRDLDMAPKKPRMHARELGSSGDLDARGKDVTGIFCQDNILASLDYASALAGLEKSCDGQQKIGQHKYSVYGQAMVYVCTYGTTGWWANADTCSTGSANDGVKTNLLTALGAIDNACGPKSSPNHITG